MTTALYSQISIHRSTAANLLMDQPTPYQSDKFDQHSPNIETNISQRISSYLSYLTTVTDPPKGATFPHPAGPSQPHHLTGLRSKLEKQDLENQLRQSVKMK